MTVSLHLAQNFDRNPLYEDLAAALRLEHVTTLPVYSRDWSLNVSLPIDFSEYAIPKRHPMESQRIFELVGAQAESATARYLRAGDFEFLAYYTCRITERVPESLKRMDWFFFLDEHLDVLLAGRPEREVCVRELITTLDGLGKLRGHEASLHGNQGREAQQELWIAAANTLLSELLAPLSDSSTSAWSVSPRQRVLESVRDYYQGLLDEEGSGSLAWYLETRIRSIGVIPEIEFCFAYFDVTLDPAESLLAGTMARAAAVMILVQNDLISARKEGVSLGSTTKLSLPSFAHSPEELALLATRLYRTQFELFQGMRPKQMNTPLGRYWLCCNDWICGSLIWHMLSPRYQNPAQPDGRESRI